MERSPSLEVASSAATQEFPRIYGTQELVTVLTKALQFSTTSSHIHPIYNAESYQSNIPFNITRPPTS
jgi:hypothetical protein